MLLFYTPWKHEFFLLISLMFHSYFVIVFTFSVPWRILVSITNIDEQEIVGEKECTEFKVKYCKSYLMKLKLKWDIKFIRYMTYQVSSNKDVSKG